LEKKPVVTGHGVCLEDSPDSATRAGGMKELAGRRARDLAIRRALDAGLQSGDKSSGGVGGAELLLQPPNTVEAVTASRAFATRQSARASSVLSELFSPRARKATKIPVGRPKPQTVEGNYGAYSTFFLIPLHTSQPILNRLCLGQSPQARRPGPMGGQQ
jgi:hypothetical protein